MRVVYTGRFYRGVRTPVSVLQALAALNRRTPLAGAIDVAFIGPHVEEFRVEADRLGLGSFVRFQGCVAASEAAAASAKADVLLVVDAPSDGASVFLPSKLVDYMSFRKPILGVTPEPGASATLLRRLGCPVAPPGDVDALAIAFEELLAHWRSGTLSVGAAFDAVAAEYDIRNTARQLADVLNNACG